MTEFDPSILIPLTTAVLGTVAAVAGAGWKKVKAELHDVRKILDIIDDAAQNDSVTEAQFQAVMATVKEMKDPEGRLQDLGVPTPTATPTTASPSEKSSTG